MPRRSLPATLALATASLVLGCGRLGVELAPVGEGDASLGSSGGTRDGGTGGLPSAGGTGGVAADAGSGGDGSGGRATGGVPGAGGVPPEAGVDAGTAGADSGTDAGDASDGRADSGCTPAVAPDYCTALPALAAEPVIDGVLDCGLALAPLVPASWNGPTPLPPEISAEYAVAYRPDGVYVFIDVVDPTQVPPPDGAEVWRGDGIEIYLDTDAVYPVAPMFDNPGTRQLQIAAPSADLTAAARGELFTCGYPDPREPWAPAGSFVARPTASGYLVEAFVRAAELNVASWSLASGGTIGLDLGINVSDPDTTTPEAKDTYRLGQFFLRAAPTGDPNPFNNVGAFCAPVLE